VSGKRALITGVTGQDGSYLAELLLAKGYEVHGVVRRASTFNRGRVEHLRSADDDQGSFRLHYGDLNDASSLQRVLANVEPDEVYNLGAQSHVRVSFEVPEYTVEVTAVGTLRLLEAMRNLGMSPRFYQASSSEMYGKVMETPQTENTPFYPRSPYACAKVFAHYATVNYRESYGLHASCGILFNHESPRRGETFVTRKITHHVARIKCGLADELRLGNLTAKRDWGFAGDYVEAMREVVPQARFYQASSSEMYGSTPPPQNETTAFQPRSPYACAKVFAHQLCQNYRDAYGLFISCGILFNHESERRGIPFVTRKITRAAARIKHGLDKKLFLGNLDARRDWGYAKDYVEAMWLMLQQDEPDDYVIATNQAHSVRELVNIAFQRVGLNPDDHVRIDPQFYRPAEVDHLIGSYDKAKEQLGWEPRTSFEELVNLMVDADLEMLGRGVPQKQAG